MAARPSALSAGFLFFLTLAAEGQPRPITPLEVARLRNVTTVALSPDGAQLAYTRAVPRRPFAEDDGPAWQELHVVSADGQARPFVARPVNLSQVRWLPDGRHLSFIQKRTGDKEPALYVIATAGIWR